MIKETEYCDLCENEVLYNKNGFIVEIGYSKGGWGSRSDFVSNKSMIICNDCFKVVEKATMKYKKTVNKLSKSIRSKI